ncbi:MAG: PAS domain S-box protein [Actinobacteria bacterium]|nr:PAS domain S-box protein [Actinomycetota bacterium]
MSTTSPVPRRMHQRLHGTSSGPASGAVHLGAGDDHFRLLAENASDVVFLVHGDGLLRWVSPSVTSVSGWSPAELVGTRPWELVHEEDREGALLALADCVVKQVPLQPIQLRFRKRDGAFLWMSARGHAVVTDGDVGALVVGLRDISAERAAVAALATSESRYRLLAENASDVVLLIRGNGLVDWVSPSAFQLTGWEADSLVGRQPWELIHPDDRDAAALTLAAAAVSEDRMPPILVRMRVIGDRYIWVSASGRQVDVGDAHPSLVVCLRLVDDLVHAREDAETHRARMQAALDSLLDPHVVLVPVRDEAGMIVDFIHAEVNDAACAELGIDREHLLMSRLRAFVSVDSGQEMVDMYAGMLATGEPVRRDDFSFLLAGSTQTRRVDLRAVRVGEAVSLTWRDVDDRFAAAEAMKATKDRFQLMAESSSDVVMGITTREVMWVSPSISETLGWSVEDWVGHRIDGYVHPDDREWFAQAGVAVRRGEAQVVRIRVLTRPGKYHWVEANARPYTDTAGQQERAVVSLRLVDSEVAAEEELERRARNDELTGLLNRKELFDRLEKANRRQRKGGDQLAVLFCDIDGFKFINDSAGHAAGDALLRAVAERISATVRRADLVGRVGGDEMVVVLDGVHGESEALAIVDKIRRAVAMPIDLPSGPAHVTISVGTTLGYSGEDVDVIVARADRAMYAAKQSRGGETLSDSAEGVGVTYGHGDGPSAPLDPSA